MKTITAGDRVEIHLEGRQMDGTLVVSTREDAPLCVRVGQGDVPQGIEDAVVGMRRGETKTVTLTAENAYGLHCTDLVRPVPRSRFDANPLPGPGEFLSFGEENGLPLLARVVAISDCEVLLDRNHPLAGMDLVFSIEVIDIV